MLKTSHMQTPRSMAEATWLHACDPIEKPQRKSNGFVRWIAFSLFAAVCLLAIAGSV